MMTWFVWTSPTSPPRATEGAVSESRNFFESERAARDHAIVAFRKGLRVEAGTLEGVQPQRRVRPDEACKWAFDGLDYVEGSWHLIALTSSADFEEFTSELRLIFMTAMSPIGCEAHERQERNESRTVFLSPSASALVVEMPGYNDRLSSCALNEGIKNDPRTKLRRIFENPT